MLLLGLALASPVDHARAALATQRPHTLVFDKESTGEVALEVTYTGPREASAVAHSPDGTYSVSVDATHMRLRLDDGRCASIDARAAFLAAHHAALELAVVDGPPGSQLVYRIKPDKTVDLSTSFQRRPDPPLFSWIEDLGREDVQLSTDDERFVATSPSSTWTVRRDTGHLARMTAGDDALVLHHVRYAEPPATAELPRAVDVCPETTSAEVAQAVGSQLHVYAGLHSLAALATAWPTLAADRREEARTRQVTWWRTYFATTLPAWGAAMAQAGWQEGVVAQMGDSAAFAAFRDQLPDDQQADAVQHWKRAWFDRLGQDLLGQYVGEVHAELLVALEQAGAPLTDEIVAQMVSAPMERAALAEAEGVLQQLLVPVVEAGGATLTP